MSEESNLRNAQGDIVPDEFFREEIGCCPKEGSGYYSYCWAYTTGTTRG